MESAFFFQQVLPLIAAGLIVPITQKIKKWAGKDWPMLYWASILILNGVVILCANWYFAMGLTLQEMWPHITGGLTVSTGIHALIKNRQKVRETNGTNFRDGGR
jgi:hypothetical protein